jgi:hypothetical protein
MVEIHDEVHLFVGNFFSDDVRLFRRPFLAEQDMTRNDCVTNLHCGILAENSAF